MGGVNGEFTFEALDLANWGANYLTLLMCVGYPPTTP